MKEKKQHKPMELYRVLPFCLVFFVGCVAPYKLMPEYEKQKDEIETIALYPLYYTDRGKEQHTFGAVFQQTFYDSVGALPLVKPVEFILPDSTISLLEAEGVSLIADTDTVEFSPDSTGYFPIYKLPTEDVYSVISNQADGLLLCDLKLYNEVTFGKAFAQGMATACLTLGMVTVMEKPIVQMDISLIETSTRKPLWLYTPEIEVSGARSLEGQRKSMAKNIIKGYRKYFPFSKSFQAK